MNNIGIDNYEELLNDANNLESKIESYNEEVKRFFEIVDNMHQFWKGEGAKATLEAISKYQENFVDMGLILSNYSEILKKSVSTFQNVESNIINK